MPIRAELRKLYPANWKDISYYVRFVREKGRCQRCGRAHGDLVHKLPDGRWFDKSTNQWRDYLGRSSKWPDIFEYAQASNTKVYLAAAHIEHDPRINGNHHYDKVASWCQRCHLIYDRKFHQLRKKITYRSRNAVGDLFVGSYKDIIIQFNIIEL
jgi:hypothetical protein